MVIYVGLPMYGGAHGLFVRCLLSLQVSLIEKGHDVIFDIVMNGSILPKVRNGIVKRFIDSQADVLLFIDSDMVFEIPTIEKLINAPFDVSAVNYRKKNNNIEYTAIPVLRDGVPTGIKDKDTWVRVESAGTGIMAIKRQIIDSMIDRYPELVYEQNVPCLFDFTLKDGKYYGEDYTFCQRASESGGKIYILADCFIGHIGDTVYGGNYHEYLRS